ncbi:hypothetical protein N878_06440 [Pseudomonas sp. EGD-AK9]|nr:hypothetical protein N878_06440 [Pseudomonas sp. EGD-AK9]
MSFHWVSLLDGSRPRLFILLHIGHIGTMGVHRKTQTPINIPNQAHRPLRRQLNIFSRLRSQTKCIIKLD